MYARVYRGGAREFVLDFAEAQDGTSCHGGRRYNVEEKTALGGNNPGSNQTVVPYENHPSWSQNSSNRRRNTKEKGVSVR